MLIASILLLFLSTRVPALGLGRHLLEGLHSGLLHSVPDGEVQDRQQHLVDEPLLEVVQYLCRSSGELVLVVLPGQELEPERDDPAALASGRHNLKGKKERCLQCHFPKQYCTIPTAMPLLVISDGIEIWIALVVLRFFFSLF